MFKIYSGNKNRQDHYFKLIELSNGIELVACDQDGGQLSSGGGILHLSQRDGIHLYTDVDERLGFPLDSVKRVVTK